MDQKRISRNNIIQLVLNCLKQKGKTIREISNNDDFASNHIEEKYRNESVWHNKQAIYDLSSKYFNLNPDSLDHKTKIQDICKQIDYIISLLQDYSIL